MDRKFAQNLMNYIEHTNSVLEKYAHYVGQLEASPQFDTQEFQTKVAEAVQILTNDGVIPKDYSEAVYNNLKNDPVKVASFLTKKSNYPNQIGEASLKPSTDGIDPIWEFCFGD